MLRRLSGRLTVWWWCWWGGWFQVYYPFTITALLNLYDYSHSPVVKAKAQALLDVISLQVRQAAVDDTALLVPDRRLALPPPPPLLMTQSDRHLTALKHGNRPFVVYLPPLVLAVQVLSVTLPDGSFISPSGRSYARHRERTTEHHLSVYLQYLIQRSDTPPPHLHTRPARPLVFKAAAEGR